MTMEYLVRFCISLFDLGVFWHYLLGTASSLLSGRENMYQNQPVRVP